jgi:alpha-galactosidase
VPEPRINGPSVFGARPNAPFLYTVPVSGERPVAFGAEGLPAGLSLDAASGRITGAVAAKGDYAVTLTAKNAKGRAEKKFRIAIGDRIALTPPMGWNSWNCWAHAVDRRRSCGRPVRSSRPD